MDIVGDRKFVEVPGDRTHELPPFLVSASRQVKSIGRVMNLAAEIIESEDVIADAEFALPEVERDRRKMDLAVNLVDQYLTLVAHWRWGDSILEWIRQCETTFQMHPELRNLLRTNVWPHAGRSSFVRLLADKAVPTGGVSLDEAVGLRLAFRQPPPMSCCTNQFLFYLNSTVASSAFEAWVHLTPLPVSYLPPERFHFAVVNMTLQ